MRTHLKYNLHAAHTISSVLQKKIKVYLAKKMKNRILYSAFPLTSDKFTAVAL